MLTAVLTPVETKEATVLSLIFLGLIFFMAGLVVGEYSDSCVASCFRIKFVCLYLLANDSIRHWMRVAFLILTKDFMVLFHCAFVIMVVRYPLT
jgi:hypothetical protein